MRRRELIGCLQMCDAALSGKVLVNDQLSVEQVEAIK